MTRGFLLWLLIMAVETLHGILRGMFLVPRLGEETAGKIALALGSFIVLLLSVLLIRWTRQSGIAALLRLGALWAFLTFIFEIAIGLLRGLDALQFWAEINPLAGGTMVYSLAVMLLAPLIAARFRPPHRTDAS